METRTGRSLSFAIVILMGLAHAVFAQGPKDPFLGKWVLDRANSTFSGAVPEKRFVTFEAVGNDGIKQILDTTAANGASDRSEFTAKFDGKEVPITNSVLDTVSLKKISANKVERSGKRKASGDMVVETQTRELSADGKKLTIVTKGVDFDGNEYESTQIFTKMQ